MLVYLFKVIMDILYAFHIERRFPINMHITFANRLVRKNIDQDLIILKLLFYIDRIAIIDQDEFAETRKNIYYIAEKAEQYIEEYKKHISGENTLDKREFRRKYGWSTLKYFHKELEIG